MDVSPVMDIMFLRVAGIMADKDQINRKFCGQLDLPHILVLFADGPLYIVFCDLAGKFRAAL
jgi:hypothetical protein